MSTLRTGQQLRCVHAQTLCIVERLIGEGGQGEVYQVHLDGQAYALKWYHDAVLRLDRGLHRRLETAIELGAPNRRFLWPFDLVTLPDGRRLGYLMPLRTPSFQKVQAVMTQQVQPSFRVLAMLCSRLADGLLALHAKGLSYQDLNAGNVFFDPASGEIEICDNDNVDVDGAPSVMGGVWEYQAPEVVLRMAGPSRATDLHSLAVMLFRLLHIGHPLLGRRELLFPNLSDAAVLRRLYGSEARFVFDPADDSNRPLPEHHGPVIGHWAIYPAFLRELFTRAFTDGLFDPANGRVQETEWRRALRRLHDAVYTCPHCGAQNFHDPQRLQSRTKSFPCWGCGAELSTAPPRLGVRRAQGARAEAPQHVIVLEDGAVLQGHHVGRDDDRAVARVERAADGRLQLHHLGTTPWRPRDSQDAPLPPVEPGETLPLTQGMRLAMESVIAEVRL